MKRISKEIKIGDKVIKLESGYLAQQANAAVLARLGDTIVLSTVVSSAMQEDLDYFPLGVEYLERLYAGGRIKGSRWVKREGKPSDEAVLTARLIDRSIRPLFPKGYKCRVQVVVTILSVDTENSPDIPAVYATSAALAASDIPWNGPVGAVRVGFVPKNGEQNFIINPTYQDLEYSEMDVVFSGTGDSMIMIEGGGKEISEKAFVSSLETASGEIKKAIIGIESFAKEINTGKQSFEKSSRTSQLAKKIKKEFGKDLEKAILGLATGEKETSLRELEAALFEKFPEEKRNEVKAAFNELVKKFIASRILEKGKRIDGRAPDEIRPLTIETGVLPRTHGSAMFKRGKTQALTIATLGSSSLGQLIESMQGEETKRYMHHYYMPPFSVGETGRLGWPSRREIGHGALAERALEQVLPSEEKFPYAIRVVSEIMSSNGSTSMAAVCGSSLSLMDAGVPIKAPVAGIAMGLMSDGKKYVVLSDILGIEDFQGEMDFKVAGTEKGITAVQMDVKNTKIPLNILPEAFELARKGRLFILKKMNQTLSASRSQVSKFAPKISVIHIPVEKIGEIIGPGGRTIKKLISETGATIDVSDDGSVSISSPNRAAVEKAVDMIQGITREVEVDDEFEGTVKRIQPFGAFVEITPGKDGLVHVSQMSTEYVKDPSEVLEIGQKVKVRVREIDEAKRINLTMLPKGYRRPQSDDSRDSRSRPRQSFSKFSPHRRR